jgi:GNAT superfamily N-acetyltransferase
VQTVTVTPTSYCHPDAQRLVAEVQQEYVQRYGGADSSPIAAAEFDPPNGLFVLATVDGTPAAMGGWRRHLGEAPDQAVAEVRRMYVSPPFRGRGLAKTILIRLEQTARTVGCRLMILETGLAQPEALGLYRSSGYRDVPAFGHYAGYPLSVHLGKQL